MAKNEAVALAREFVASKHMKFYDEMLQTKPTIAQTIRDAAVNWSGLLSLEKDICLSFCRFDEYHEFGETASNDARVFMLLVAEALE